MPIILCRHGATAKNLEGGTDDRSTPLHPEGIAQAQATGPLLAAFCQENGLARVQPVTSGYDRATATCAAALQAFAGTNCEILPLIEDDRIGEIKFRPREIRPSLAQPGVFGRVIEGPSLAQILTRLAAFDAEHLRKVDPATLLVAFGHRTTNRLLAMTHLARDIAWMETLPRMDNCELWLLQSAGITVLHPGYPAMRDEADPRREGIYKIF